MTDMLTPPNAFPAVAPAPISVPAAEPNAPAFAHESERAWRPPAIHSLLAQLIEFGGSDLHLTVGIRPRGRIHGELIDLEGTTVMTRDVLFGFIQEAFPAATYDKWVKEFDFDTAYEMDTKAGAVLSSRFRVNLFMEGGEPAAVFRVIPVEIRTMEDLNLKDSIQQLIKNTPRGLILVTGVTGSGKSTTLAGMMDWININRAVRILTFEDPIEFVHKSKRGTISQREIAIDTKDWRSGLKAVLRQDPDVILIGELRDPETIEMAIAAADTGHLVFGTLHTGTAADTVDRIVGEFPGNQQERIQSRLSTVLAGVVCQQLVPGIKGGRVVATEIMIMTDAIRANIRKGDLGGIGHAMADTSHGSISFDAHLAELVATGFITRRNAIQRAVNRKEFEKLVPAESTMY
ncbi:twitching motility protein PilT (plasmid) [Frondihabitans sucicola]|uniref:Twitching motility protein PilT n=1 Tax=Frondihabitans sucicola TaxID=1268041 RepID=A0ABN6Y5C8_9MICO|nr:PilT/PilU family type 4a pilus ATPase [Frondihabitans sucicola]BDZ52489.1 twitching motility protein PilT [Frondihabitans sucicola]